MYILNKFVLEKINFKRCFLIESKYLNIRTLFYSRKNILLTINIDINKKWSDEKIISINFLNAYC